MEYITDDIKTYYDKEFSEISLTDKKIASKEFDGCTFSHCDFSDAKFESCIFSECTFIKCNLNLLNVINSKFSNVEFKECKMLGIDWTKAYWRGVALGSPLRFSTCMINSSSFYGLNQAGIVFDECRAHDVDFREANLSKANFEKTDLTQSLFNGTNLTSANLNGALNYDININNNIVKHAKFCRYEAVRLLESLGITLMG